MRLNGFKKAMRGHLTGTITLMTLLGCPIGWHALASDTFTGIAARSGTFKRPLLDVDGTCYELKAADTAEALVLEWLTQFSEGDTGKYVVTGIRDTIHGNNGIIIESIVPFAEENPIPAPAAKVAAPGGMFSVMDSAKTEVASSVVSVGGDRYKVYDYDDWRARNYSFVIPEGLKVVRGLLVHGCYSGGDSRFDWKECDYYRQFMHLHGFAYVGATGSAGPPNNVPPQPKPVDDSAKARSTPSRARSSNGMYATKSP